MKTLIAFYSRTGTTKKAALEIAKLLKADVDEIIDKKDRSGAMGWLYAGGDATLSKLTEIKKPKKNPGKYDLVVIGTPIWSFNMTPAVRTYISKNKFKKVAFFCTEGGSGSRRAFKAMHEVSGKNPLAHLVLRTKEVWKGNIKEKIKEFAEKLG